MRAAAAKAPAWAALLILCAAALAAQAPQRLGTGWRIQPAGTQIPVGALPMSSVLSPDGRFLLVLNAGVPASVSVIRTDTLSEASRLELPGAWKGLAFSSDGRNVYVGGGSRNSVFELAFSAAGALSVSKEMAVAQTRTANDFIGDVAIPPAGRLVYAADLLHDQILVFNPQSGRVIDRFKTGRRPYQILFHPDGKSYWVSSWADGAVYQHETDTGYEMSRIRLGPHPTGMVLSDRRLPDDTGDTRYRLFVTAQNTNNVFVVSVDGSKLMDTADVLNIGFAATQPAGMTPLALALSRDQTRLFVVCPDVNAVAVADVSEGRSRLAGFLPVGAYPTGARVLDDGGIAVLNGAGNSVSVIPRLDDAALEKHTDAALALLEYHGDPVAAEFPASIRNVVYISPGQAQGPNRRKLASEFAAPRGYTPNTEAPVESLYWSLAGLAPPFTRLLSHTLPEARFQSAEPANLPPAGYLWTNAASARIEARNYGVLTAAAKAGFLEELDAFERTGMLPRLVLLRAETDAELGRIVERISKSPFWASTAVFIGGGPPVVVSPYSRGAAVPEGFYNDSSVLRTMESILNLRPMTLFDAAAHPLAGVFSGPLNSAPFEPAP